MLRQIILSFVWMVDNSDEQAVMRLPPMAIDMSDSAAQMDELELSGVE